eukprot:Awhi_evm1s6622
MGKKEKQGIIMGKNKNYYNNFNNNNYCYDDNNNNYYYDDNNNNHYYDNDDNYYYDNDNNYHFNDKSNENDNFYFQNNDNEYFDNNDTDGYGYYYHIGYYYDKSVPETEVSAPQSSDNKVYVVMKLIHGAGEDTYFGKIAGLYYKKEDAQAKVDYTMKRIDKKYNKDDSWFMSHNTASGERHNWCDYNVYWDEREISKNDIMNNKLYVAVKLVHEAGQDSNFGKVLGVYYKKEYAEAKVNYIKERVCNKYNKNDSWYVENTGGSRHTKNGQVNFGLGFRANGERSNWCQYHVFWEEKEIS